MAERTTGVGDDRAPVRAVGSRRRPCCTRRHGDRGTALLLVPAGILILVILAAIAIDLSHLHVAQMRLADTAQAAANDAATFAIPPGGLQDGESVQLDQARVEEAARRTLASSAALVEGSIRLRNWEARTVNGDTVEIRLEAEIGHVFFQGVPGVRGPSSFTATAVANARQDGAP